MKRFTLIGLVVAIVLGTGSDAEGRSVPTRVAAQTFYASLALGDAVVFPETFVLAGEPIHRGNHSPVSANHCSRPRPGIYRCGFTLRYWFDEVGKVTGAEYNGPRQRCEPKALVTRRAYRFPERHWDCPPDVIRPI